MSKVYVINGYSGSGKNTFINCLRKASPDKIYYISSIEYVRDWAKDVLGYDGERDENARQMLSLAKRLLTVWCDGPYQATVECVDDAIKAGFEYIFIDCREPEEILRYVARYDAKTVFINRKYRDWKIPDNDSDRNVEKIPYDITISNNGTLDDLQHQAEIFLEFER